MEQSLAAQWSAPYSNGASWGASNLRHPTSATRAGCTSHPAAAAGAGAPFLHPPAHTFFACSDCLSSPVQSTGAPRRARDPSRGWVSGPPVHCATMLPMSDRAGAEAVPAARRLHRAVRNIIVLSLHRHSNSKSCSRRSHSRIGPLPVCTWV